MKKFFYVAFATVLLISIGCNDGSIIGNDLLENEAIDLDYDESYILSGKTTRGDSVATFRSGITANTYLLGEIIDPVFGKYSSDIYAGIAFGSSLPDFEDATIDSIVLELEYDSLGFYGRDDVIHNFEVFTIEEDWLDRDTIYSDQSLAVSMMRIGHKSIVPDFRGDSIRFQVRDMDVDSFIMLSPRLNIRLDNSFGQMLLDNEEAAASDTALIEAFKGLYIKSTTEGNSMIGLNFVKSGTITTLIPKVAVYYTQVTTTGTVQKSYNYLLRNEVYSQYKLDNMGTLVGNSINDKKIGDDVLYAQGMSGVNGEVTLPDLSALKDNLINSAQLVVVINEDDVDQYEANRRFLLSRYDDNGERVLIQDIIKTGDVSEGLGILGGIPRKVLHESGDSVTTVTFNITDFVKDAVDSDDLAPRVVISPVGRTETPRRTIFYGTKHPTYPAKLRIAYTIL